MKIYIERKIESEKDLPKEKGYYLAYSKFGRVPEKIYAFETDNQESTEYWEEYCESWLEPIEVSDEEIEEWAKEQFMPAKDYSHLTEIQEAILICFKAGCSYGAKSALSGQIKKRK